MLFQALCIISYPLVNSNWSYSPETPNLGQIWRFLEPCDHEIWQMTLQNNWAPLQALCSILYPLVNSNWSYSPETPNLGQIWRFLELCDLEIWRMTFKNNRAPLLSNIKLYVSFHHHMWIKLELQCGNAQFGSNSTIFRAVRPWNLTDALEKQ